MDIASYVTQTECEERRKELEKEFEGINIRVVVMETQFKTAIVLLKTITTLCVTILGSVIINFIIK